MKKNCWLFVGTLLSTSLLAQPVTNAPGAAPVEAPPPAPVMTNVTPAPATPAPATNTPAEATPALTTPPAEAMPAPTNAPAAKKAAKKKAAPKKKAIAKKKSSAPQLKTVPLVSGPAVAIADHVNVRGQPKLKSEVLTRLTNGEPVTVFQEIVRNDSGPDEPSAWAKIALPAGAHTWVNSSYIDTANKTVKAKKLNFRSGPGENYSVLGQLMKGDSISEVTSKGDWIEIEPPTGAYGYVAAQYLRQGGPEIVSTEPTTTTPTTTTTVTEAPPLATTTTTVPTATATPTNTTSETIASTTPTEPTVATNEPPPKRIIQHEGIVKGTGSIQAPTPFQLVGDDGRIVDYLYTSSPDLDLRRYKGLKIIVTGEEAIEERWPNTPIITIQSIKVMNDVSGESN